MRTGMKMMALGTVAVLAIAGFALLVMSPNNDSTIRLANETPLVAIESDADEETVLVTAMVEGESVPMGGIQVMICKMNASTDGNQTTIRVMECVTLQTGEDGKVQYPFQDGERYMIRAQNHNHYGYANQNMNQTEADLCYQYAWNWQNMEGQIFQYTNQVMIQA